MQTAPGDASTSAATDVPDARGLPAPRFVLPSGGGIGYGGFVLDARQPALSADAPAGHRGSADARRRLGDAVGRDARSAGRQPSSIIDLALRALPREADEQNVQRILGYTRQAYWKFLPAAERARGRAAARADVLRAGLARRPTSEPQVGVVLGAARRRAITEPTVAWLERVWRKTETVPGLTLAEPDYITLALAARACASARRGTRSSTEQLGAHRESGSQGAVRSSCGRRCRPTSRCATRSSSV